MRGLDVSEHDNNRHGGRLGPEFFKGYGFAIVRVANENGYPDAWAQANIKDVREAGLELGIYAWPVAGLGREWNRAHGRRIAQGYPGATIGYWADQEHSPRGLASPDEVEGFCQGVQDAGAGPGFYSNIGEMPSTPFLNSLPWWVADYGPNDGSYHHPNDEAPKPVRPWDVHQFTSVGGPGGLDVNEADLPALLARFGRGAVDDVLETIDGQTLYYYDGLEYIAVWGPDVVPPRISDPSKFGVVTVTDTEFARKASRRASLVAEVIAGMAGIPLVVPPLPPGTSAQSRNTAATLRKTTLGVKE